jgi:two-component system, response regulator PdtaR
VNSKRILVVDDQLARALRLRGVLHEAGYQTSWAESAADAIVTACRERPVLTLIEARLPNQSAVSLGGMLRDRLDAQWVCVVDHTADVDEVRQTALSGALALIIRPADLRLIASTVDAAVACAVEVHRLRETGRQLHEALEKSRATSIASGVLMERFRLDRHRAIGLLRDNARSQRRRLADIAEEVLASVERINAALGAPQDSKGTG